MPLEKANWQAILKKAAQSGRDAILSGYDPQARRITVGKGAGGDETLRIDAASESAIHETLDSELGKGSYVFLSEEIGEVKSAGLDEARPIVICDPLDGSHNAQIGLPLFAVALSVVGINRPLKDNEKRTFGQVDTACILSVLTDDEYSAQKGLGAYHNGSKMKRRDQDIQRLETLLIECGDAEYLKQYMLKLTNDFVYKTRILGSAALSYCYLADGTADGMLFVQPGGARTIDSPSGYLIAREAGCVFQELSGKHASVDEIEIGFHSKMNIAGANSSATLSRLLSKVR